MESVDILDLKSGGRIGRAGSSPALSTKVRQSAMAGCFALGRV